MSELEIKLYDASKNNQIEEVKSLLNGENKVDINWQNPSDVNK